MNLRTNLGVLIRARRPVPLWLSKQPLNRTAPGNHSQDSDSLH